LYYVKIKNSDREHEELVVVRAGEKTTKTLEFPKILDATENNDSQFSAIKRSLKNTLKNETKNDSMTTVIALASRMKPYEPSNENLGLLESMEIIDKTGFHLIVGSDLKEKNKEFIDKLKIKIWKQTDSESKNELELKRFNETEGFGQWVKLLSTGSYFMSLESEGQRPVIFSICIPNQCMTNFILQQDKNSKSRIFQHFPLLTPGRFGVGKEDEIFAIRQQEIVQRYYHSDIQNYFYRDALKLAYGKWQDPMAGLISGNLMLRNMKKLEVYSLEAISRNMIEYFDEIPDSHILRGRVQSKANKGKSKSSFCKALLCGVPIFTENLEAIYHTIKDEDFTENLEAIYHTIKDEDFTENGDKRKLIENSKLIKEIFKKRIRGSLWTCYTP